MSAPTPTKSFKKGFKFRIYPTPDQRQSLKELFGSNRFVWNQLLAQAVEARKRFLEDTDLGLTPAKAVVSGYDFCAAIPKLKDQHPWLKNHSSVSYQQTALHLGKAFSTFFANVAKGKKPGYPKFKSKRNKQSVCLTTAAFKVKEERFHVAKILDHFSPVWSRKLPSTPSSCSVSMTASGEYYVSFICDYTPPPTSGERVIGVDLGLTHLAILSDGTKIDNPKHFQRTQRHLKRLQQQHAKGKKGSKNREKSRLKVAKCYTRITQQRTDYLHKVSRNLVNDSQVIGLETLKVTNMMRNAKLAKHIASVSWATLVAQVMYKAKESQHCTVVFTSPWFASSHICAATGLHLGRKLLLTERQWSCPHCDEVHDRDVNAAQNLAIEAMAQVKHMRDSDKDVRGGVFIATDNRRR